MVLAIISMPVFIIVILSELATESKCLSVELIPPNYNEDLLETIGYMFNSIGRNQRARGGKSKYPSRSPSTLLKFIKIMLFLC